ncbi:hypothetical protein ACNJYA_03660 [Bradyrhizobium sp. DASA03068]|uniref:hypothetical protein n=1 Tax=Bradyrhizobium sp. BLXBL-01 TaxID=3395915 RepID=UPI003F702FFB
MDHASNVSPESAVSVSLIAKTLDTTAGSGLHAIAEWLDRRGLGAFTPVALYAGAVTFTFLPLLIAACFGVPMAARSATLNLPFFYDVSTIFMYLVSFPCLLILTTTDHALLCRSLNRVQVDGILNTSEGSAVFLVARWNRIFRRINLGAQAVGMLAGVIAVYFVYRLIADGAYTSWESGHPLSAAGYIRMYCDFLFAIVAAVYVIRSSALPVLLWEVVSHSDLRMLPLHPDNAGGLRPIGRLGLRNQYAISLVGLNIGLGWLVSHFFTPNEARVGFLVVAVIAYSVVGPFVFIGPLLPFRDAMMKSKAQLMSGVALRMRAQLDDLRSRFQSGVITADDEQMIERLRKIGAVINDMPVWPFDALTMRKFLTAYVIPPIVSFIVPLLKKILGYFQVI